MDLLEKIKESAQAKLPSDQFIVEILYSGKKTPSKLVIIVDGDNGVTIDACAELSRELSRELDETNLIEEAFVLEVSTPGLDHPLKLKRQYYKNRGRQFKVQRKDKKIVLGKLMEVTEEYVTLEQEKKEGKKKELIMTPISFDEIEKAFVMVSFK